MTDDKSPSDRPRRIVLTGAAGGVGSMTRPLLAPLYPGLVLSDRMEPKDLQPGETFVKADLTRPEEVAAAVKGADGVIHLGGHSVEGSWDQILNANIIGCYNLFEAAHRKGVKRIVFASSNHAMGFHPRKTKIGVEAVPKPDTRYGLSKLFGEGLGALYAHKHGMGVLSIRIGNFGDKPVDQRRLAIWLKPDDLVQLIRIGLEKPDLVYEVVYGMSDNKRAWWDNSRALALGYSPTGQSETFAAAALEAQKALPKDAIGDYFQGGSPFCSQEFDGDFGRLKKLP